MSKEQFADLEKIKIEILREKAEAGISEFEKDSSKQWTNLRFERPLLEKLLSLIKQTEQVEDLEEIAKYNFTQHKCQQESTFELERQNKCYREVLELADGELGRVLQSNEALLMKLIHLENLKRILSETLEGEE